MTTSPRPLAMRASLARSTAAAALALLATAAIVGCQPAVAPAHAQPTAAASAPSVSVVSAQQGAGA